MPYFSIRSSIISMVSNDIFQSLCALSSPTCLTYSSMPSSKPLIACPPLRPEAPKPTLAPSKTMTFFLFPPVLMLQINQKSSPDHTYISMFNLSERRELKILVTRVEIIRANVFLIGKIKHKNPLGKNWQNLTPKGKYVKPFRKKCYTARTQNLRVL